VGLPAIVTSGVGPQTVSWANYFKPAVCKHTLGNLANFVWWRAARWLRTPHRWKWKDLRRRLTRPQRAVEADRGRWSRVVQPDDAAEAGLAVAAPHHRAAACDRHRQWPSASRDAVDPCPTRTRWRCGLKHPSGRADQGFQRSIRTAWWSLRVAAVRNVSEAEAGHTGRQRVRLGGGVAGHMLRAARTMAVTPVLRRAWPGRWSGVAWMLWALAMLTLATVPWLDRLLR